MGRQKRIKVVPIDTSNVTPETVTKDTFPEGTPIAPDGTVAGEGSISLSQARKIGAVTAGDAAKNKRVAKIAARKANGETNINWNEDDALQLFDYITMSYPTTSLIIYITMVFPDTLQYPPVNASAFRTNMDLYNHVLKNIHKTRESAKYQIQFKDMTSKTFRGTGHLMMPSTLGDRTGDSMNQYPPPPPYGYPPAPPLGSAQPYPTPYGYPAPPMTQPQYVPSSPQQLAATAPQVPQPMQPPQAQPPQGAVDPLIMQLLTEIRDMKREQQMNAMQNAQAMGALEEFKRLQAHQNAFPQQPLQEVHAVPPPPPQPPPAPPQAQPPQGFGYAPQQYANAFPNPPQQPWGPPLPQQIQAPQPAYDSYGRFMGYMPAPSQNQGPQARGFGGPPPPPPPAPAQPQQSPGSNFAEAITQMVHTLDTIKTAVGVGRATPQQDEEDDEMPGIPPPESPFTTTRLGFNDDAPVLVTRKDGSVDTLGTVMGNMGQLPNLMHKVANGISSINQQATQLNRARAITVEPTPQQHYPTQQRVLPPPPPAPPPQPPPQQLIPDISSLIG